MSHRAWIGPMLGSDGCVIFCTSGVLPRTNPGHLPWRLLVSLRCLLRFEEPHGSINEQIMGLERFIPFRDTNR